MADELLTLEEVAQQLRVSITTVRRLIKEHQMRAVKVRGQLRIRREDLDDYLRKL